MSVAAANVITSESFKKWYFEQYGIFNSKSFYTREEFEKAEKVKKLMYGVGFRHQNLASTWKHGGPNAHRLIKFKDREYVVYLGSGFTTKFGTFLRNAWLSFVQESLDSHYVSDELLALSQLASRFVIKGYDPYSIDCRFGKDMKEGFTVAHKGWVTKEDIDLREFNNFVYLPPQRTLRRRMKKDHKVTVIGPTDWNLELIHTTLGKIASGEQKVHRPKLKFSIDELLMQYSKKARI